jgi:C-terminal peptidase prc
VPGGILGKYFGLKSFSVHYLARAIVCSLLLGPTGLSAAIPPIPTLPALPWGFPASSEKSSVHCAQAYSIAQWAHRRFGGPKPAPFQSQKYAERVATALLEKWDPYKVLHTQTEAKQLKQQFKKHWHQFSEARSCLALAEVIESHVKKLEARIEKVSQEVELKAVLPTTFRQTERFGDSQIYRYDYYLSTSTKFKDRFESQLNSILKDLTIAWWAAFDKDGRKLVTSIIQTRFGIDSDKSSPHWILVGSLAALDPYSTYLTETEFDDLTKDLSGMASGVGVRIRTIPMGLMVRQVLEDSPAGRSQALKAGDWITEVNGQPLKALSEHAKQDALRGNAGEHLTLKVQRGDVNLTVQLQREAIHLEDAKVSYHLFPLAKGQGEVAIIRIPSFYGESGWNAQGENLSAAMDVEKSLNEILASKKKIAAIVLDLRGNPGGFLEEAVSMAGLFLGNQPVVGVAQGETVKILRNYHRKPLYSGPLVVALDPDSASASEVLAGALADNGRGVLVAEGHTYGKGSVQRLFPLKEIGDNELPLPNASKVGAVKLTTSLFFSPKGISPEGPGVQAHIRVGEKRTSVGKTYRLKKVYEAAVAAVDKNETLRPSVSQTTIRTLESKSRSRNKLTTDSLSKSLSKVLRADRTAEVSPGLVEAVAIARDFNGPAVAVKN